MKFHPLLAPAMSDSHSRYNCGGGFCVVEIVNLDGFHSAASDINFTLYS